MPASTAAWWISRRPIVSWVVRKNPFLVKGTELKAQVLVSLWSRLDHNDGDLIVGSAPASAAAAFESLAGLMLSGERHVSIVAAESDGVTMRWLGSAIGEITELGPTIHVWAEVGVPITVDETSPAVNLRILPDISGTGGPIATALRRAKAPQASPLAGAVANLLHDLKNQVTAADLLASAPDQGSRTARLETELAASRASRSGGGARRAYSCRFLPAQSYPHGADVVVHVPSTLCLWPCSFAFPPWCHSMLGQATKNWPLP